MISAEQLRRIGLSASEIKYRVRVGRLRRMHRGVFAVGHASLTDAGEIRAAVLAVGAGTAAGGLSALALWGIRERREGEPVFVTVARRVRAPRGVRVSSVTKLPARDTSTRHGIPVLMPGPALLESATLLGAKALRRAVNEALVQKRVSIPVLVELIARNHGRRGVARLAAVLLDAHPTRSDLEDALVAFLLAFEFEDFETNAAIGPDEVDVLFRQQRLVIEADGGQFHDNPIARANDTAKQARIEEQGFRVERVRWVDLTARQRRTAERLYAGAGVNP